MPDLKLHLVHNQPYDWPALLRFFAARAIPGADEVDGTIYRRTFAIGRARGRLSISPTKGAIVADIATTGKVDEAQLTDRLRRLFDLDAPGRRIAAHLKRDDTLETSLKKRRGLRVPGVWDPFELGVRAILGQQVSVAGASTLAGRIATRFGKTAAKGHATLIRLFPTPDELADVSLDGIGLTTRRAATVINFARAVRDDGTLLKAGQPLDTFVERIADLPGLGPWTAHYMAMRLGHTDAFPASDLGVRKALNTTSDKEVLRLAERWRPYRAYATMHLWASLSD